jgi:hypothetical protein
VFNSNCNSRVTSVNELTLLREELVYSYKITVHVWLVDTISLQSLEKNSAFIVQNM